MMHDPRDIAVRAHGDQKYGSRPYADHLDEVVAVLAEYGYEDPDSRAVGYLHDTLEDTSTTPADLRTLGIPLVVVEAVQFCTDEPGPNRRTRKALTYQRYHGQIRLWLGDHREVMPFVPLGIRGKLADRLANLRAASRDGSDLLSMYRKERDAFRETYHVPGLCDPMWTEYERLLA